MAELEDMEDLVEALSVSFKAVAELEDMEDLVEALTVSFKLEQLRRRAEEE